MHDQFLNLLNNIDNNLSTLKSIEELQATLENNHCNYFYNFFNEINDLIRNFYHNQEAISDSTKSFINEKHLKSLNNDSVNQRPNLYGLQQIFHQTYTDDVKQFIMRNIDNFQTLSLHKQVYSIYLMAQKSDVPSLRMAAINSITSSILGTNSNFNSIDPLIYAQKTYIDDEMDRYGGLHQNSFKYNYEQFGYTYYMIPNKVTTKGERLNYLINKTAHSLNISYSIKNKNFVDQYNYNSMLHILPNSIVITKLLTSFWSSIKIDDPELIMEAKKLLDLPPNDFARISAEAFITANSSKEVLNGHIAQINSDNYKKFLNLLFNTNFSKITPIQRPVYNQQKDNKNEYNRKLKIYNDFYKSWQKQKKLAQALIHMSHKKEVKKWLREFFSIQKHLEMEIELEVKQYLLIAAYSSNDLEIKQLTTSFANYETESSTDTITWFQTLYSRVKSYFQGVAWAAPPKYNKHLVELFSPQCNIEFIKNNLLKRNHVKQINNNLLATDIILECLSSKKIDEIIASNIEQLFFGTAPDIDNIIDKISSPDINFITIDETNIKALYRYTSLTTVNISRIKNYIENAITYLTLYEDQSLFGKILFLGLTNQGEIRAFTLNLIKNRILGNDSNFNNNLGYLYDSQKLREQYFFTQIFYGDKYDLLYPEEILNILYELDFNYDNIKISVEEIANSNLNYDNDNLENDLAKEYIKKIKGEDYLNNILTGNKKDKFYFVINGGYSPTSNDQYHEYAIESFDRFLFNGEAFIFNAGGYRTLLSSVNKFGHKIRDTNGIIKIEESKYAKKNLKAITKNISLVVDKIIKENPKKVSFVYIGHGGQYGMALWDERMNITKQKSYLKKFDKSTIIQTFFSSCHAAANIVSPHRILPFQSSNLVNFLKFNYPINQCALAVSMHDEFGQSYAVAGGNSFQNEWTTIFKSSPKLSLANLQRILHGRGIHQDRGADGKVSSTPILTSDYFLNDIAQVICNENKALDDSTLKEECNSPFCMEFAPKSIREYLQPEYLDIWNDIIFLSCSDEHKNEMQQFHDNYSKYKIWYKKIESLKNTVLKRYLKINQPDIYQEYKTYKKKYDVLEKKYINRSNSKEAYKAFSNFRIRPPLSYSIMDESADTIDLFNEIFNKVIFNIMESEEDQIIIRGGELLGRHAIYMEDQKQSENSNNNISFNLEEINYLRTNYNHYLKNKKNNNSNKNYQLQRIISNKIHSNGRLIQVKRQTYLKKYMGKLRFIIEQLLTDPYMTPIQKRYKTIRNCENIPFN